MYRKSTFGVRFFNGQTWETLTEIVNGQSVPVEFDTHTEAYQEAGILCRENDAVETSIVRFDREFAFDRETGRLVPVAAAA